MGLKLGDTGYRLATIAATEPQLVTAWTRILVVAPILHAAACAFPKLVVLTLYLRIFVVEKRSRVACYALISLVLALCVADIIVGASKCVPLEYLWRQNGDERCAVVVRYFQVSTVPNVLVDICMILLPLPVVWNLQTSRQAKIGVTIMFLTGGM